MERDIKKYKRSIINEPYCTDLKERMNINNFKIKNEDIIFLNEDNINQSLRNDIFNLPKDIQKKLYITTMKEYWKKKTLDTPLKPIWYETLEKINHQRKMCFFKNIHFLHLECNTLKSNKEYIPGCQCEDCLKENLDIIDMHCSNILNDYSYFYKQIHCYDNLPNFWNIYQLIYILNNHKPNIKNKYTQIRNTLPAIPDESDLEVLSIKNLRFLVEYNGIVSRGLSKSSCISTLLYIIMDGIFKDANEFPSPRITTLKVYDPFIGSTYKSLGIIPPEFYQEIHQII